MLQLFVSFADLAGISSTVWPLLLTGALSGAGLTTLFNTVVATIKERSLYRRQKLEELHRSVFALTLGIRTSLLGLKAALDTRDTLLTTKEGYVLAKRGQDQPETFRLPANKEDFTQEKLDKCHGRIRQIREAFPKDLVLSELETFVRLTSVYFKELVDERFPFADYVMEAVMLHSFEPESRVTTHLGDEATTAQQLSFQGDKIRVRLLKRIWELSEPRGKRLLLPWARPISLPLREDNAVKD